MYDPARDSYVASDESPSNTARCSTISEIHPSPSQGKSLDATGLDAHQGRESHLVSGHLDAGIVTQISESGPLGVVEKRANVNARRSPLTFGDPQNTSTCSQSISHLDLTESLKEENFVLPSESVRADQTSMDLKESQVHELKNTPQTSPQESRPPTGNSEAATTTEKRSLSGPHNDKKRKLPTTDQTAENPVIDKDQPRPKRKRLQERLQKNRRRGKTPPSAYSRRDDIPSQFQRDPRPRSPSPIRRSPSPDAAPVRQRKRPGGGARINTANLEALKKRQEERERQRQEEAQKELLDRGVHDVVRQHYNAVPERGREWRKTDSKIKGLRSFNNWIKSTIIQKFSPDEDFLTRNNGNGWTGGPPEEEKRLLVLDVGCGKGGDLGKWQQAPQPVELYVGLDPAEVSIDQARDRYNSMKHDRRRRRGYPLYHAEFHTKDCFGEWLGDLSIIQRVGIDGNIGPNGSLMSSRWGGGGFDIVASMFTMHYAFESEEKARQMLQNVAGALKKGGRFLGVGPNSDVISAKVAEFHKKRKENLATTAEQEDAGSGREEGQVDEMLEWGNSIYRVRFPGETPEDGIFRPAFGWKYSYFMEEAVEEIPEYVVPWEAFRALTQDYNLELQYRKPFLDIWREEKDDPVLGPLSERMGVQSRDGAMLVNEEELEAASLYHAFCFYKV
ncbi:mRNA cap guanine-N7 methyltransferase [Emydomyces testavorans]|uniref:mRNA cap guanine-N(7) methyltransferase n=1 Tax=Emydomyces testavorans TaxID=2070801 RepID=A0AAF0IIS5_9EURO|nr:mRNA cap guanine-N7 methyltransferase [Emydomyces testavorans]